MIGVNFNRAESRYFLHRLMHGKSLEHRGQWSIGESDGQRPWPRLPISQNFA